MGAPIHAGEQPPSVLLPGKTGRRIKRRSRSLLSERRGERAVQKISQGSEGCIQSHEIRSERPTVGAVAVTLITSHRHRPTCSAPAENARKISVKQMVLAQRQPSSQVARPGLGMSDRQRLLGLPSSILKPVSRRALRIKYQQARRIALEDGDIQNAFRLRPQKSF